MSDNLNFDIVAICILIVLLIYFQRKRSAVIASYRMFYVLLQILIGTAILDVITEIMAMNPGVASVHIMVVCNILNMCFQLFILTAYTVYLLFVATIETRISSNWFYAIVLPSAIQILTVIVFGIRGAVIGEPPYAFRMNPVLLTIQIAAVIYELALCAIISVRYRKMLQMKKCFRTVFSAVFISAVMILQYIRPDTLILPFLGSLVMIDLLHSVQRPEEIFEASDAMKKKFLYESADLDLKRGRKFDVIFIKILDYSVLTESLGKEDTEMFLKQVTAFISELKWNSLVFQLDADMMAVKISSEDRPQADSLFEEIRERFRQPWRSGLMETMIAVGYLRMNCPGDVQDMEGFEHVVGNLNMAHIQPGEIFPLEDILGDDKEQLMLKAIRRALDENSFQVYYQPIYSTREKKIVAAEALIRLFDPDIGFVPPEPMIALAEKEGYILRIGEIVFTEVCRFYSENNLSELGVEYIEVNLSAVQCMQKRLAEQFIAIMRRFNLSSDRINFEITESSAMISDVEVSRNIADFRLHGVSLSLDDYGTGYSNISYLYNLPFLFMKVDKSILWTSEENEKADIILKNTFRMAQRLHMKVVMEGVETEAQIKKLLGLKCDYFQGYYFSKPIDGKSFIAYLKNFELPEVCK